MAAALAPPLHGAWLGTGSSMHDGARPLSGLGPSLPRRLLYRSSGRRSLAKWHIRRVATPSMPTRGLGIHLWTARRAHLRICLHMLTREVYTSNSVARRWLATGIRVRRGVYTSGRKGCSEGDRTTTALALQPLMSRSIPRTGFNGNLRGT